MTPKEKQRELIVGIMKADEQSGLYDDPARKQTAVEWYFTELWSAPKDKFIWHSILERAKQMEKEQIIQSHIYGQSEWDYKPVEAINKKLAEDYYKEKYE